MIITVSWWNPLAFKKGSEVLVFTQGDIALCWCPRLLAHSTKACAFGIKGRMSGGFAHRRELNRVTWSPQALTAWLKCPTLKTWEVPITSPPLLKNKKHSSSTSVFFCSEQLLFSKRWEKLAWLPPSHFCHSFSENNTPCPSQHPQRAMEAGRSKEPEKQQAEQKPPVVQESAKAPDYKSFICRSYKKIKWKQ